MAVFAALLLLCGALVAGVALVVWLSVAALEGD